MYYTWRKKQIGQNEDFFHLQTSVLNVLFLWSDHMCIIHTSVNKPSHSCHNSNMTLPWLRCHAVTRWIISHEVFRHFIRVLHNMHCIFHILEEKLCVAMLEWVCIHPFCCCLAVWQFLFSLDSWITVDRTDTNMVPHSTPSKTHIHIRPNKIYIYIVNNFLATSEKQHVTITI